MTALIGATGTKSAMLNKPFCVAPWHSIYIDQTGRVDNCCLSKNNLGTTKNINQAINVNNLAVKDAMINHKEINGCRPCYNVSRSYAMTFQDTANSSVHELTYRADQEFKLLYADVRWRNTCDSACVYCTKEFSSSWARELNDTLIIKKENLDGVKEWLFPRLGDLKIVYLAGGEPLLIKENEWLLENLLEINPDVSLLINSNIQNFDTKTFGLLKEFKTVHWLISGENTKDHYEYVRFGSKWKTFTNNLSILKNYYDPKDIFFNPVLHILNTEDIFNYFDYLLNEGFNSSNISISYIYGNENSLSPANLPQEEIDLFIIRAREYIQKVPDLQNTINNAIMQIKKTDNLLNTFNFLKTLDLRRNLNSQKLWPELWKYNLNKHN